MRFGPVPVAEAEGALLAHSQTIGEQRLAKGHRLSAGDVALAMDRGIDHLVVARLDPDDLAEDAVAALIGAALAGSGIVASPPVHGRVNLRAAADGVLIVDVAALAALNLVDEAITLGTLSAWSRARAGEIVGTVKVIPYAVAQAVVDRAADAAGQALLSIAPFVPTAIDLIHTTLPHLPEKLIAKTGRVMRARLSPIGGDIRAEQQCAHDEAALTALLSHATPARITLIAAASATVDRRDVVPVAIVAAGGVVERLGMPVDPGNLLCIGRIGARIVIGLPGCARSPKRNGIDLVLERLLAGLKVDSAAIAQMGQGGLLAESGVRPEPRERPAPASGPVQPIVLAAGRASRMGTNKLVEDIGGKPVIAHVAAAIAAAGLPSPIVVLGHDPASVRHALHDRPVRFVDAPDHGEGLSQSLRSGVLALPEDAVATIVCLGDMPFVPPALLRSMAAQATANAILVPRYDGRAGNPVLWGRTWFPRLATLAGDVGAKALLGELADRVRFIDWVDDSIHFDIDTPEALRQAQAASR